ncbi:MAG: hypothetical protein D3910_25370, partial [Candidatus Electrothrix sp. ATG2]|nr:hypothetical protein [Candidatus Electrothrix sp. ATG2]
SEDDWQEILRLICGQLDEQFAGKIIAHLTDWIDMRAWDGEMPLPELVLAVWCLSEVRNLNKIQEKIGGDLLLKVVGCFLRGTRGNHRLAWQLLAAAKDIGTVWPGKFRFDFILQYPVEWWEFQVTWPQFLAAVFKQRRWIEQLAGVENNFIRSGSFFTLNQYWPDEKAYQLFKEFSRFDGAAASFYGGKHSKFGKFIFERVLLYHDPRNPIPVEHIQQAAEAAGLPPDKIDETVRSLSEHLGWDITKGSKAGKL